MIEKRPYSWWIKQDSLLRIHGGEPADVLLAYLDGLAGFGGDQLQHLERFADFLVVNSFFSILDYWTSRQISAALDRDGYLFFMRLKIMAMVERGRFEELAKLIASGGMGERRKQWIHATICRLYSGKSPALFVEDGQYQMPFSGHGSDLSFWVLSLPSDVYRREKLAGLFRYNSCFYSFFDGVKPSEMPLDSPIFNLDKKMAAHPELLKGNFGCVYSTYLLYSHLFRSAQDDYYLIVEDDIVTLAPLRLDGSSPLREALDRYELIYLNDRLQCSGQAPEPVQDALMWMDSSAAIKKNAPGNDGYIIKRSALQKMLDYFDEVKISDFGADWMLLMNSLSPADLERFKPGSLYRRMAERYRPFSQRRPPISACVLPDPVVKHAPRSTWNSWR